VGDWLRDIGPILSAGKRPIIVGGTGLYFRALTEGLADIPPIPANIRAQSSGLLSQGGLQPMHPAAAAASGGLSCAAFNQPGGLAQRQAEATL
jgi:tRNA dimethylallyltransferase